MTEKRLSLPAAVIFLEGKLCNQKIRYHCFVGHLSYERQGKHIFVKEADLKRFYEKWKTGAYPTGPKPLKFNYNAAPDEVFVANEA
jgi:hypothetical protein